MTGEIDFSTRVSLARKLRRNQTGAEAKLWSRLRNKRLGGHHFYRQQPIGPYIVDFCSRSRKLIIEVDGSQHLDQKVQDDIRTAYLESLGFRVLRFWNDDVLKDIDTVLQVILNELECGDSAPGVS
jgi:very-short-patch-repair endonuclease